VIGGHILTEAGNFLTTEAGDRLVTQDFVPDPDVVVTTTTGGIYWKPEKDYEWPDLPGDVLSSVHAAVRELAGEEDEAPTVTEVVAAVQPQAFAMPPGIDMAELAERIRSAATMAIGQWQVQQREFDEYDDEEAIVALLH
jgi:hypothetical protein